MEKGKPKNKTGVEAIGTNLFVVGSRGAWDVQLLVRIAGQDKYVSVRSVSDDFSLSRFRDDARLTRDLVRHALAIGQVIYGAVDLPEATDPDCKLRDGSKVFPIDPQKFSVKWKSPQTMLLYSKVSG